MRMTKAIFLGGLMVAVLAACAGRGGPEPLTSEVAQNPAYYTQIGMWASERGEVLGTNYSVGIHIPPNSRVSVGRVANDRVVFTVEGLDDRQYQLVNTEYTGEDIQGLFQRTFDRNQLDMSRYSADMHDAIMRGEVQNRMTRDEVIAARGYPPAHQTPSLDGNQWRFWRNRFATRMVTFDADGRVTDAP